MTAGHVTLLTLQTGSCRRFRCLGRYTVEDILLLRDGADFESKLQPASAPSRAHHRPQSAPSKPRSDSGVGYGNVDALLELDRKHTAGLTFSRFVKARVDLSLPGFSFPEEEQQQQHISSLSAEATQLVLSENGEAGSGEGHEHHTIAGYCGDNRESSKMFAVHRGLNVRGA